MDNEKIALMKERILNEIKKIDDKEMTFFFYVTDTKGNPSGSLSYIYDLALGLKNMGYKVAMLHGEDDFVGVGEWLGEKYAELPHHNIGKGSIDVSPSDFLIIPEIYSNVMTATKKLPCEKVGLVQSFSRLVELIPFGASWENLGMFKAITTSEQNAKRLKSYFPKTDVSVVRPKISDVFNNTVSEKQLIVNIVARDTTDVSRIVKPFFWQYPIYQWVAFRDLRGMKREEFAKALDEAAITIWVDDVTDFGYTPLEAMKSGSIVIGKVPENAPEWMDNGDVLTNAGIWVDSVYNIPGVLASVVRTWTMDMIPEEIFDESKKIVSNFTEGKQLQDLKDVFIDKLVADRRQDFVNTLESLDNNVENK